jgi:hypothetical protein
MDMTVARSIVCLVLVALGAAAPSADTLSDPRERPAPAAARNAAARPAATIIGAAWRHDNSPIPNALLRLRNVATGRIEMTTRADSDGRFTFGNIEGGNYVIELVDETGAVRAVGQMFSIAPGETVATFIRLGAQLPWFSGFFSNAAAAAVSSAAGLGLTAVGTGPQPASARF